MQDFYSGLLGGFQQRQDQVEAQTRADAESSRQRERSVYSTLLQSDDPEIQHLALTGILDSAAPGKKKKGMAGWLGELEQAPAFGAIRSLLDSPAFKSSTKESLPSTQYADSPKLPGGTPPPSLNQTADPSAPLAQPNTALTQQQPGGPNPPPIPSSQQDPAGQSAGDQAQQQATLGVPPEVQQQAAGLAQADGLQSLPDAAATFIHQQTPQVQTGGQDSPLTLGPPKPRGVATSQPNYGLRPDGTPKGNGFLGPLQIPGTNSVASEYSIANSEQLKDANGNYLDYPSLVPTLTPEEVQQVLIAARDHQPVPASVEQKAEAFALQRKAQGLPLFAQPGEEQGRGGPPAPRGVASPSQSYEVPAARRVFAPPEELVYRREMAQVRAEVEGDKARVAAGLLPRYGVRAAAGPTGASQTYVEGNITPDPASPTGFSQLLYRRDNPTITQSIPAMDPVKAHTAAPHFYGQELEAIAQSYDGKPFAEHTVEEKVFLTDRQRQIAISQAGATSAARGVSQNLTKLASPLSPETAATQGVPFGTSMRDLAGTTPITPVDRGRLQAANALAPDVEEIAQLIKEVLPDGTGLLGGLTASMVVAQKRASRDPQLARLDGALARAAGNIAKVLNAESGRLTQQDVERAMKSLTDLQGYTDTQASGLAKLHDVEAALQKIQQDIKTPLAQRQTLQGAGAPPPPTVSGRPSIPVVTPDGTTVYFPNQVSADGFKRAHNIP